MKTKKVVIQFVGVSMTMAVTVQTKGHAEADKPPGHQTTKKEPENSLVLLSPGC